jgi:hypothetical protein
MADKRANNGGARTGAGRKPKAEELALIERLSPLDDLAIKKLEAGVKQGEFAFIKMFFEYRFGKPKEKVEHSGGLQINWSEEKTYAP